MKRISIFILTCIAIVAFCVFLQKPIILGGMTKQTIYLWLVNIWHSQTKDAQPTAMLIDDDSGNGIYTIKEICDELGIKATFAVIPSRLDSMKADALRQWQQNGYGIALHGYNHEKWKDWSKKDVIDDIERSELLLKDLGFQTDFQFIVPPYACNTSKIRDAIQAKGYKMITGANIINPDMTVFQYGRISIDINSTNMEDYRELLSQAYKKNSFVIFGTHSSMSESFSKNKTKAILQMAIEMGFKFK